MAQKILWNKWVHMKQVSNNLKMKLDWAQNQPQEVREIEPRFNIGGEDTCKDKVGWQA
jgi:hypothetical protein